MATLQNFPDIVKSFKNLATNPSEFTTADLRNVSIGLQLVTGMTTRATRAYKDSNLAAKSATPKEQRYGFERIDADGKKTRQNLDDADIKALTEAKGQKNIDAVIDQIATKYNLSDSEKSALKLAGPTGMGFKHNKPFLWRNTVEDAPTQKESVGYYLTNPQKRAEALTNRSTEDFNRAVKGGASKKRVERHLEINNISKKAKGGILKAQNGLDYLETPYTKKLKQLYDIKLNPNGMITGSTPTGIGIDKPTDPTKSETSSLPMETDVIEFPSMFKELDNDYHVDLMGTKRQAKQHAENFAKDHPGFDHFWWKGKKYELNGKSDE